MISPCHAAPTALYRSPDGSLSTHCVICGRETPGPLAAPVAPRLVPALPQPAAAAGWRARHDWQRPGVPMPATSPRLPRVRPAATTRPESPLMRLRRELLARSGLEVKP